MSVGLVLARGDDGGSQSPWSWVGLGMGHYAAWCHPVSPTSAVPAWLTSLRSGVEVMLLELGTRELCPGPSECRSLLCPGKSSGCILQPQLRGGGNTQPWRAGNSRNYFTSFPLALRLPASPRGLWAALRDARTGHTACAHGMGVLDTRELPTCACLACTVEQEPATGAAAGGRKPPHFLARPLGSSSSHLRVLSINTLAGEIFITRAGGFAFHTSAPAQLRVCLQLSLDGAGAVSVPRVRSLRPQRCSAGFPCRPRVLWAPPGGLQC